MRRFKTGVIVAGALAAAVLVVGAVSAGAASDPKCAESAGDIIGETHGPVTFWNPTTGAGSLNVDVQTESPACKFLTYTLVVSGVTGAEVVVSQRGDSSFLGVAYTDTDDEVCLSATVSGKKGVVHDVAPDTACLPIQSGTAGGGSGFS